ncbi:MAG: thioredoxin domain-containing protein [Desulfovibrionaceae bacterium]|nr:thioredoxin domain-containing protein [Desulfovibrionaceae bacterium]
MKTAKFLSALALALVCMAAPARAAQPVTEENLARMLRQVFQEKPELVMEVLRQNSESVLDIAQQGSTLRRKRSLEGQWREDMKQPKKVALANRPVMGPAAAPVTIVAFSDFTCPYCQQGAATLTRILGDYGDNVRYIFKHMPLGKDTPGRMASEYFVAAALQNPEKAWKLYTEFFEQRERLIADGEPFLKETAKNAGLDMRKLAADLKNKKATAIIDEDLADAQRLGVEGTPYFLVNNLVVRGALSYDLFKDAVDMALSQARKK